MPVKDTSGGYTGPYPEVPTTPDHTDHPEIQPLPHGVVEGTDESSTVTPPEVPVVEHSETDPHDAAPGATDESATDAPPEVEQEAHSETEPTTDVTTEGSTDEGNQGATVVRDSLPENPIPSEELDPGDSTDDSSTVAPPNVPAGQPHVETAPQDAAPGETSGGSA